MRPILALNCLLQIEHERSEEESSVGGVLALAFRCARFCLASLILFFFVFTPTPSNEALPLCSILCNLFPRLRWYVEVFKGGFEGGLPLTTMGAFSDLYFSIDGLFFVVFFVFVFLFFLVIFANVHQAV